ncbi:ABC transporter ATP-binding protein [Tropicimonas isoalkanivorans]|uniref:Spermidine/putrescine transport system ATP-binding protein n=1 Tax=Tropicimonas isoalkanivorans TaxID=441112 RepID=A0A1I1DJ54_9RHOB|nr:ABC transporter ATP-binding protein [Tropicimonas isoalkanivorans]SFB74392.1 spermidine/putrescine transport system ATP-binding protein [Tropicimonas isoalkanivorans]
MTTPERRAESEESGRPRRPLLEAKGLYKSYGKVEAVSGVDFALAENSYVTLLGPSGCGKTSILRMIGGFEEVTSGALTLDGARLDEIPAAKRPINTVFQNYALFPHLSVVENVAFGLSYREIPRSEIRPRALHALEIVQMDAMADRRPRQLSGGQQQRVALARAIVNAPRLLLLDEPLSALDRRMRKDMQIELKDLQRRLGMSFLHVTHDQEEAFALSDRIIVMRDGRIEQQGRPEDIYARPRTAYVADFIGGAACVPALTLERNGDEVTLDTPLGKHRVHGVATLTGGAPAVLCLRPENLSLADAGIPARVTHCVFRGSDWIVECEIAGQLVQVTATSSPPPPGTDVHVSFDPARAWAAAADQRAA